MDTKVGNYFISNYPPFSTWCEEEIPVLEDVLNSPAPGEPLAVYVHVPFCRQRCHYCYYRVYPARGRDAVELYIGALLRELNLWELRNAMADRPLIAAYFGGGSPSFPEAKQLERLLRGIREIFPWTSLEECTFECDPGTLDRRKLEVLHREGVTRLSIGVQTLTEGVLAQSGRQQSADQCIEAYRIALDAGFSEINVDLLAGLPGETEDSWRRTIDRIVRLEPGCVTIYQLELAWNSVLHSRRSCGCNGPTLPDWPTKRNWVDTAFLALEEAGYTIASGYMAVKDPSSWRFVYTVEHYWRGGDLLAIGESSFGHFRGVHYQNFDRQETYLDAVRRGELPVRRARRISPDEAFRRELILALKTGRADRNGFLAKHGVELADRFAEPLADLAARGLLHLDEKGITLTRKGLLCVDDLLQHFYLPEHRGIRYS